MKINNIIFCENTQQQHTPGSEPYSVLHNPLPWIKLPYFPVMYSFSVSFGVYDLVHEETPLYFELVDPKGKKVRTVDLKVPFSQIPEKDRGLTCCLELKNVNFEIEGEYSITIRVGDVTRTETILVGKVEP